MLSIQDVSDRPQFGAVISLGSSSAVVLPSLKERWRLSWHVPAGGVAGREQTARDARWPVAPTAPTGVSTQEGSDCGQMKVQRQITGNRCRTFCAREKPRRGWLARRRPGRRSSSRPDTCRATPPRIPRRSTSSAGHKDAWAASRGRRGDTRPFSSKRCSYL